MANTLLLISPPFYRLMGSHYNGIHLGLSYISSVLTQHGYETLIYNADYLDSTAYLDQRELFENFETYKSILNDSNYPIWVEVRDAIKNINPDYLGIQMYTGTFKSAQNVAKIAKTLNPEIKVIVGGTHPTLDPIGTINFEHYDYVIRGEGEYTFLDILNRVDPIKIKGLTFKDEKGEIINNDDREFIDDLDALPFPTRDQFYGVNGKIDIGAIITSRGCPFKCKYCASPEIWKRKTRYRSVANVLEELEYMVRFFNPPLIRFQDDTFTLNKDRAASICEGILNKQLNIQWICDTRVDRLDKELLMLMKQSGCVRI